MKTTRILGWALSLGLMTSCGHFLNGKMEEGNGIHRASLESGCFQNDWPMVLLGAGMKAPGELSDFSLARVDGTVKFILNHRETKTSTLIFSGGPVHSTNGATEAALMDEKFQLQIKGLKLKIQTLEERESLNTKQNAALVGKLLDSKGIKRKVILMTGIFHARRAQENFREQGFDVCTAVIAGKEELRAYKD